MESETGGRDPVLRIIMRTISKWTSGFLSTMGNATDGAVLLSGSKKGWSWVVGALRTIAPEASVSALCLRSSRSRGKFQAGPYVVDAFRVNHRVTCYGYRITIEERQV